MTVTADATEPLQIDAPITGPDDQLAEVLDEFANQATGRDGFTVTDDQQARWAARILRRERAEVDRIRRNATHARQEVMDAAAILIADIEADEHDQLAPHLKQVERFENLLIDYRRHLEDQDPKLAGTYRFVGGAVKRVKGRESVEVVDADGFVAWAEQSAPGLLRTKVEIDKQAVKDAPLNRTEDGLLFDGVGSGEVVPGVRIVTGDDTYTVDLAP